MCLIIKNFIFLILFLLHKTSSNNSGTLYPYGSSEGDTANPRADDDCSVVYSQSISMLGKKFSRIYVCTNGVLSLDKPYDKFMPESFPLNSSTALIAPFWADADLCQGGNVWSREKTNPTLLEKASAEVRNAYNTGTTASYTATWMMIATWDNMLPFAGSSVPCPNRTSVANSKTNTFQAVIVSDGRTTFAMFHYKSINWVNGSVPLSTPAQVGFDVGDGVNYYATTDSQKPAIVKISGDSNVGIPGKMIFMLGRTIITPDNITSTAPLTTASTRPPTITLNTLTKTTTTAPTTLTAKVVKSDSLSTAVIQAIPQTRAIPPSPPTMQTTLKPSSPLTPVTVNISTIAVTTESSPSPSSIGRINATLSSMDQKTGTKRVRKMYHFAIGTEKTLADPTDAIVISCVSVWVILLMAALVVSYVISRQRLSGVARKRPDKNISEVRKFSVI